MWNVNKAANLFKISGQSIRTYCDEFSMHLSPQANPGGGKTKNFTDDDMEVFALIVEMRGQGKQYADMHAALMNSQRGRLPNDIDAAIMQQPKYVQLELKIDFLEGVAKEKELEIVRLAALLDRSDTQLSDARKEIRVLYEEIGQLKANIKPS